MQGSINYESKRVQQFIIDTIFNISDMFINKFHDSSPYDWPKKGPTNLYFYPPTEITL
jgi:hypothetical protein